MNRREVRRELRARLAEAEAAAGLDEIASTLCGSCGFPMAARRDKSGCSHVCSNEECPNSRHPQREGYFEETVPGIRDSFQRSYPE